MLSVCFHNLLFPFLIKCTQIRCLPTWSHWNLSGRSYKLPSMMLISMLSQSSSLTLPEHSALADFLLSHRSLLLSFLVGFSSYPSALSFVTSAPALFLSYSCSLGIVSSLMALNTIYFPTSLTLHSRLEMSLQNARLIYQTAYSICPFGVYLTS